MGPFERAVEAAEISEDQTFSQIARGLWEAPKVDYWRTTDGGHRVGFSGKPGKGTPVAGNPHVLGHKGPTDDETRRAKKKKASKGYRDRLKKIKQNHAARKSAANDASSRAATASIGSRDRKAAADKAAKKKKARKGKKRTWTGKYVKGSKGQKIKQYVWK